MQYRKTKKQPGEFANLYHEWLAYAVAHPFGFRYFEEGLTKSQVLAHRHQVVSLLTALREYPLMELHKPILHGVMRCSMPEAPDGTYSFGLKYTPPAQEIIELYSHPADQRARAEKFSQ